MPTDVFAQRNTPIIADDGPPPGGYSGSFGQLLLRPVYYHFLTLIGYPGNSPGPANGVMFSSLGTEMQAGNPCGIFYCWNVNETDDPFTVGGFYHGSDDNSGFMPPLVFSNWGQVQGLMIAGANPNAAFVGFYQLLTGNT